MVNVTGHGHVILMHTLDRDGCDRTIGLGILKGSESQRGKGFGRTERATYWLRSCFQLCKRCEFPVSVRQAPSHIVAICC